MKKFLIVLINIVILICTYFICEYTCFLYEIYRAKPLVAGSNVPFIEFAKYRNHYFLEKICVNFDKAYKLQPFRPVSGTEYSDKKSIILFGCSFVWGSGLEDNQTFSAKLSDYVKRKVYNRGICGWGPQDMLYQLKRDDFYNETIKEEPEIVIYTFMTDHTSRVYKEVWGFEVQTFYRKYKDGLKEAFFKSGNPLYGYTARQIRRVWASRVAYTLKSPDFVIRHFTESKKEIEKHWKNTKFCVFVYYCNDFERWYLEKLRDYGIDVIFSDELTDENLYHIDYQISKYDMHPNENAWNLLVPLLADRLNLKS